MQKVHIDPDRHARGTRRLGIIRLPLTLGALGLAMVLVGCRETAAAPKEAAASGAVAASADLPDVLATVGETKVTLADVRARAGDDLDKLETQYQLMRSRIVSTVLDSLIRERTLGAEAKKKGKSIDELVAAEAGSGGFAPTDLEITSWYEKNPERVGGRPLADVKPQIVTYLTNVKQKEAERKLEDRIRAENKVVLNFEPFRFKFDNEGAPTAGKKDAPVELVEFSDFQCPFCQRMAPTLKEVKQKYPDKVKIVYRQFPLTNIHPFAFKAAEASLCANEQGKFWELHDVMFSDQKKLGVSDLKAAAKSLGMDEGKFNSCLDSGRYVEQVQKDSKEAQRLGVTGTPAIFINGVQLNGGAVPYTVVEDAIEKELSRASANR
jgi:protein-disulfide isomerase